MVKILMLEITPQKEELVLSTVYLVAMTLRAVLVQHLPDLAHVLLKTYLAAVVTAEPELLVD